MIVQVNMKTYRAGEAHEVWFLYDVEFADLSALNDRLAAAGTVYGERIESERAPSGARIETRRHGFILGREAVLSICPPRYELLPPEAAVAAQ